jgi:hypothetical protein
MLWVLYQHKTTGNFATPGVNKPECSARQVTSRALGWDALKLASARTAQLQ